MTTADDQVAGWLQNAKALAGNDAAAVDIATGATAQWAMVEMMGHRRLFGLLSEVELGGGKLLRLDVLDRTGQAFGATQFIGNGSIYALTLCTEAVARKSAAERSGWRVPALTYAGGDPDDDDPDGEEF